MRAALLPVVVLTLSLAACGLRPPPMAGGIHINEPDLDAWSQALLGAGLDTVQVTAYARQAAWNSADLGFANQDASEVIVQLEAAKRARLRVVLVLRTYLEHALPENRHLWHGRIHPRDDALDAWFDNYAEYARWGAALAQEYDVDLLVVGNELNSMTSTRFPEAEINPHEYFLNTERTAKVRDDLTACAASVQALGRASDLSHWDGGRFATLHDQLVDAERARRAWAIEVTGGGTPDAIRSRLEARGRLLDARWRTLIEDVRTMYRGPVTYGANFDQFQRVGFWDALDAVGVTSYFPLTLWGASDGALLARMRSSWEGVASALTEAATVDPEASPLPVYLLELGWTRLAGSTVRPWSYDRVEVLETVGEVEPGAAQPLTCVHWATQPEAPQERVEALSVLADLVDDGGFDALRGFSLWKLTTRDYHHEGERFAILVPAAVDNNTPIPADTAMLEAAARLGRLLKALGRRSTKSARVGPLERSP